MPKTYITLKVVKTTLEFVSVIVGRSSCYNMGNHDIGLNDESRMLLGYIKHVQ